MTLVPLQAVAQEVGLRPFAARQIADWLYRKNIRTLDDMSNLPAAARALLAEKYELGLLAPVREQVSRDGTKKYLYPAAGGRFIETAWIPDEERGTLCVSTQVGCKMGCLFCQTARQGFQAQLTAGEIINQLRSLPERDAVTNIVFMGMGEPLDNLSAVLDSVAILTADWGFAMSPRRISVSTVGLLPALKDFLAKTECHLSVSLHSPFDEERRRIMPIQHAQPLADVLQVIRKHAFRGQRRVFFEYILFKGINDTPRHVKELVRILNGITCRINLMRFHPVPDVPLQGSDEETIERFRQALNDKGIVSTVRRSRGLDIAAACGLLSTRALVKP